MTVKIDATHDQARKSWVESANTASDFPIQNLPLGIYSRNGEQQPRFGIAIGDSILDLNAALEAGLLHGDAAEAARAGQAGTLNDLFAAPARLRQALRHSVAELLDANSEAGRGAATQAAKLLHAQSDSKLHLPTRIGDYTDFFAGIHHARASFAQFNPDNPLPENYKYVPIGYHGRASTVIPTGAEIHRPYGQRRQVPGQPPSFGPCERLDLELEMGFYIGRGNEFGKPIGIAEANDHIVGLCLLNDWSARDIQGWEMYPLGPFLSKNFATSVSPWVVTMEALAPFRGAVDPRPAGDPAPLPYLYDADDQAWGGFDVKLRVGLQTAAMRAKKTAPETIIISNARYLYWTFGQMITHHSVTGCSMRPGDLIGTGTISGPTREELSSMLELTFSGTKPVTLQDGETRGFLQDGDKIVFTARCEREGFASIGFGQCAGTIIP